MIITEKLEAPISCWCGEDINSMTIAYGKTPYAISCSYCKQTLDDFFPSGIGYDQNEKNAVEGYQDMCEAVEYLASRKIKATPRALSEYWYRKFKGWSSNPTKFDIDYEPSKWSRGRGKC